MKGVLFKKVILALFLFSILVSGSSLFARSKGSKLASLKRQSDFLGVWKTNQGQLVISQFGKWITASLDNTNFIGMQPKYSKRKLFLKYFNQKKMKMTKIVLRLSKNKTTFTAKLNRKIWIGSRIKKAHADFMLSAAKLDFSGKWRTEFGIFNIEQKEDLLKGKVGNYKVLGKIRNNKAFLKLKKGRNKEKKAILELIGNGPWITVRLVKAKKMFLGVKLPNK